MAAQALHFLLFPLMAQGHMIPMIDVAKLLAERGARVTLITTPVNALRNKAATDRFTELGLPINSVEFPFPCKEVGLPEGCENIDLLPSPHLAPNFFQATSLLRAPLESYIKAHQPLPSCMICDLGLPWTMEIARELKIPRLVFHGTSCFTLLCYHNIRRHNLYHTITDDSEPFLLPDLPQRIESTIAQAPGFFPMPGWEKLRNAMLEADATADGVLLNSFEDLEPWFIRSYREGVGKIWAVGPLCLSSRDVGSKVGRGNKASVNEHQCLSWLDSMEQASVIYVSFSTLTHTRASQLIEIGLGLEASGWPFIWVIKEAEMSPEVGQWLSEGFEERTKTKGIIIRGWAPQVAILSHPAIGGFVTHCGWNSVLEDVSGGLPMITWPHAFDQFLNEKLIVEVLRIGVAIGVKSPVTFVDERPPVLVKREKVEKVVRDLMDGGEEGEGRRKRATELGEKAKQAIDEGGSSYLDMTILIEYISKLANKDTEGKKV